MVVVVAFVILLGLVAVSFVVNLVTRRRFMAEAEAGELTEEDLDEVTGANMQWELRAAGAGRRSFWSLRRVRKQVPGEEA